MMKIACVVVLALLAVHASQAFVIGPNDGVNYFKAAVQVVRSDRTDFVLQPQRAQNPGTTPYGTETELQYPPGYCANHPLSLNHFVDGAGVALLVWCDGAGVAHVLQATDSIELFSLVTRSDCDIETPYTCEWSADLLARGVNLTCSDFLGSDYDDASSYEVLLGVPTSRPYSTVGKSWFIVNDLSGAMARFLGTTLGTGNDLVAQLQLPLSELYPAGANTLELGDTIELACIHQQSPLRFGADPLFDSIGPDIYSDFAGTDVFINEGDITSLGWWAAPINEVLYSAAADTADKDAWCEALFPGTHAASARHVEIMLQSHVSPFNSFFTFVNSPSFCLDNQGGYNINADPRHFRFPSANNVGKRGVPTPPTIDELFDELTHILRCLPLGVVVADYCAPLLPQSFSPSHSDDWNFDWTNQTLLGANASTSSQLPLLTEAQYALDWCMHNDTCRQDNCNYQSPPGSAVCDSYVNKASQNTALSFTPSNPPFYSRKYATHGVLACTTLPRDAPAVDNCVELEHFQPDPVCCRENSGPFKCYDAPALLDPQHLTANVTWKGATEPFTIDLFVAGSPNIILGFAAFFRVLPNKHIGANCFTVTSDKFSTVQVWATGCGYSDDCDAWTHVSSFDNTFPLSFDVASGSSFSLPVAEFDCALFIGIGDLFAPKTTEERGFSFVNYELTWDPTGVSCAA